MKIFLSFSLLIFSTALWSQSFADALLFTQEDLSGTARYTGLAGSFGALGGDLSAIADNPAAAGVFNYSEMGLVAAINNQEITSTYFSNTTVQEQSQFRFNHFGLVYTLKNSIENTDWTKIAFAFNIKKVADFGAKRNALGTNSNQNLGDYFTYYADGLATENIELFDDESIPGVYEYLGNNFGYGAQQAFLGYQSYIIDPLEDDGRNTQYRSNVSGNVQHDWSSQQNGRHYKYNFAFSGVYKDKLYLGAALNSHSLEFEHRTILRERSTNSNSLVQSIAFENIVNTYGSGFSAQVGMIFKLPLSFRLGISYQSPVWWTFEEEGQQALESEGLFDNGLVTTIVEPDVVNRFPDYQLRIPSVTRLSLAYIFKKKGLLSVDYSRSNINELQFDTESQGNYLGSLNNLFQNNFIARDKISVGGEYRMGRIQLQVGYLSASNPDRKIQKADRAYTTGLSYDLGGNLFGVSMVNHTRNRQEAIYSEGLTSAVTTEAVRTQIFLTYLLKL